MSNKQDIHAYFIKAIELSKQAGKIIREASTKSKNVETKSCSADLVTETDRQVEKFLFDGFMNSFPDHRFIGEEGTEKDREFTSAPTWIIDPVDGTTNFVHGVPFVAVSIALTIDKEVVIGVIYNPFLDLLYTACKGKGAFCNGKKLEVSKQTDISKALIFCECGSIRDPEVMDSVFSNLHSVVPLAHGCRSLGSAALDIASVASGIGDVYFEYGIHCWDFAAASLIVRESGGVVLDPTGEPFDLMSRRILCASSTELAQQIIPLLKHLDFERD